MSTSDLIVAHAEAIARKLRDGAIERDQNYASALDVIGEFANNGLLGRAADPLNWPALVCAVAIISDGDASVGELFAVHTGALATVAIRGSDDLRQRILAQVVAGEWLGGTLDLGLSGSPRDVFEAKVPTKGAAVLEGPRQLIVGTPSTRWLLVGVDPVESDHFTPAKVALVGLVDSLRGEDLRGHQFFGLRGSAHPLAGSARSIIVRTQLLEPRDTDVESGLLAFVHAMIGALHTGIATNALDEGVEYVRHRARPWIDANVASAQEDPLTLRRYGELATRVHALEEMLLEVAILLEENYESSTRLLFAQEFHAFARRVSVEVASTVIELGGTSAADEKLGLDRHWRNARALSLHTDVRALDRALGRYEPHVGPWPSRREFFAGAGSQVR